MQADIFAKRRNHTLLFFALVVVFTIASVTITQYDFQKGFTSFFKAFSWGAANFYPNTKSFSRLPDILSGLWGTVMISITSTTVAGIFSMCLALVGSRTTRIHGVFTVIARGVASFFRNIPLVAWAMILMLAFSQSELTGFLALFFGSLGFLTRAFMEAMDEVSEHTIEALKATGASTVHIVFQAVIPSSLPQIVSWLLYMIETNIRDATLVGLLTGTGIGFIFDVFYKAFDYHTASLVVVVVVFAVIIMEKVSNLIRGMIL